VTPGSRGKGKTFEADYEAEGYDARMEGRTAFGMAGDEELAAQVSMFFLKVSNIDMKEYIGCPLAWPACLVLVE
jgi:hypothetical protein